MKKKVITALLITMTLTLGGVGTAYAMNNDMAVLSGEAINDVNMIKEGFIWVVDKESWTETIHHEEEGHYENGKLLEPEKGHYETIHHEAEYKTVHHEAEYKHHEAIYDTIHHEEEGHWEIRTICHNCGADISGHASDHIEEHFQEGCLSYGDKEVWIVDKAEWDEKVLVKPAWDELIKEAWDEQVLVKPAWDEDYWVVDKPAVYEQVWVVDKPAWTETITHPEEGHWEPVKDEEKPENPEQKPDEEKPETPEQKPDEETPETPEQNPDEETPEKPDNSNTDNRQDSTEDTSKDKTDNKTDNKTDSKKEDTNTAPKTGDPTNLAYLATLAGSALVGGVSWKFRKRK